MTVFSVGATFYAGDRGVQKPVSALHIIITTLCEHAAESPESLTYVALKQLLDHLITKDMKVLERAEIAVGIPLLTKKILVDGFKGKLFTLIYILIYSGACFPALPEEQLQIWLPIIKNKNIFEQYPIVSMLERDSSDVLTKLKAALFIVTNQGYEELTDYRGYEDELQNRCTYSIKIPFLRILMRTCAKDSDGSQEIQKMIVTISDRVSNNNYQTSDILLNVAGTSGTTELIERWAKKYPHLITREFLTKAPFYNQPTSLEAAITRYIPRNVEKLLSIWLAQAKNELGIGNPGHEKEFIEFKIKLWELFFSCIINESMPISKKYLSQYQLIFQIFIQAIGSPEILYGHEDYRRAMKMICKSDNAFTPHLWDVLFLQTTLVAEKIAPLCLEFLDDAIKSCQLENIKQSLKLYSKYVVAITEENKKKILSSILYQLYACFWENRIPNDKRFQQRIKEYEEIFRFFLTVWGVAPMKKVFEGAEFYTPRLNLYINGLIAEYKRLLFSALIVSDLGNNKGRVIPGVVTIIADYLTSDAPDTLVVSGAANLVAPHSSSVDEKDIEIDASLASNNEIKEEIKGEPKETEALVTSSTPGLTDEQFLQNVQRALAVTRIYYSQSGANNTSEQKELAPTASKAEDVKSNAPSLNKNSEEKRVAYPCSYGDEKVAQITQKSFSEAEIIKLRKDKMEADAIVAQYNHAKILAHMIPITDVQKRGFVFTLNVATSKGSLAAPFLLAEATLDKEDLPVDSTLHYSYLFKIFINAKRLQKAHLLKDLAQDEKETTLEALWGFVQYRMGTVSHRNIQHMLDQFTLFSALNQTDTISYRLSLKKNLDDAFQALKICYEIAKDNILHPYFETLFNYYEGKYGDKYKNAEQFALLDREFGERYREILNSTTQSQHQNIPADNTINAENDEGGQNLSRRTCVIS